MNFKKAATIAAVAGALAAVSVPAMALENEFHGFYQIKGILSNYNDGAAIDQSPAKLKENAQANNFAEQRARIFYTAKANDDLKLVTGFEMDTRFGGVTNGKYTNTSDAGVLDGDGINFETKWAYLDFNANKAVNVKVGLLPYKDTLKGLFIDADIPALITTTKLNPLTLVMGYSRYNEINQTNTGLAAGRLGDRATDLFILDASIAPTKDIKAGFSYYLLANYLALNQPQLLHTFDVNAEAKLGPLTVSGFAAAQLGHQKNTNIAGTNVNGTNTNYHGVALNAAAKLAVGPGTVKTAILFTSGDNGSDNSNTAWQGSGVQSYNENGMMLLVRNNATSGTTTDNEFVRRTISNVTLATVGFDAQITPKAYANANLGLAWAAKNRGFGATTVHNGTNYLGSELALEGGYKVYDNLTASLQASYLLLGGYYNNSAADNAKEDPSNPYTARIVLTYAF